ncbi:MAG: hypothetical protein CL946_12155 [Ectothiorhodospiraceae bacterium]|nr:hypothetical protein [Ectothiorhodospiraceae bacterium]
MKSSTLVRAGFGVLILLSIVSTPASSQDTESKTKPKKAVQNLIPARPENFRVGLRGAMAHFSGDVQTGGEVFDGAENPFTPGGDLFFGYRLPPFSDVAHFGFKGLIGYRRLIARHPQYEFVNIMFPMSVSIYTELFPLAFLRPYGSVGVSFLPYSLSVRRNEVPSNVRVEFAGNESSSTIGFPLRVGIVYSINRAIDIEVTFEKELTLSDRMDGIVSSRNDNLETFGVGFLYYFYDAETADTDGDGITDKDEEELGFDIRNNDQDDDGLTDGDEIFFYKTDPKNPDSDGDGLSDYDEVAEYNTDPMDTDSEGDGLSDFDEIKVYNTNPLSWDTDRDGMTDLFEIREGADPNNPDSDGDGVRDGDDQCPKVPETYNNYQDKDGCPDEKPSIVDNPDIDKIVVMQNLEFELGSAEYLTVDSESIIRAYEALKAAPELKIEISGHTDSTGDYQSNLDLSLERARTIRDLLIRKGISADRIVAKGYGPDRPIAPNDTEEGRARNRRIQFKILIGN